MSGKKFGLFVAGILAAAAGVGCGGGMEMEYPEEVVDTGQPAQVSQQLFGNSCNNIEITIHNSRERNGVTTAIKVDRVEAWSESQGTWLNEDLSDEIISYGYGRTWNDEDLAGGGGDLLTQWRVYYRYKEADGDWSDMVYQTINTPDQYCSADGNFSMTVQ